MFNQQKRLLSHFLLDWRHTGLRWKLNCLVWCTVGLGGSLVDENRSRFPLSASVPSGIGSRWLPDLQCTKRPYTYTHKYTHTYSVPTMYVGSTQNRVYGTALIVTRAACNFLDNCLIFLWKLYFKNDYQN